MARTRRRNRGQIRSRGAGKWLVRVYLGTNPQTGKKKYSSKVVRGSKKEAQQRLTEMLRDVDTNHYVEPSNDTVRGYLRGWIKGKDGVSERTLSDYKTRLERDVIAYIGDLKLQDLTRNSVKQLYKELRTGDRKLSPRTIRITHAILNQALKQAVRDRMIQYNPCEDIELPRRDHKEMQVLTFEETKAFLGYTEANSDFHTLWVVLLSTGMRPNEALGLKWTDLRDGAFHLQRALVKTKKDGYKVDYPKTRGSRRKISLPPSTLRVLEEHRKAQVADMLRKGYRSEWVFTNSVGNYWDLSKVRRRFKRDLENAAKETGVETLVTDKGKARLRLYDTRHTHATHLLLKGANPKTVAERLGHSTVRLTLDTYSHYLPELDEQTTGLVEAAMFG